MRFLVLQHIACEHPGVFADFLRERRIETHTAELEAGDSIPDPAEFDALLVFGGPMGVYEGERYPWLGPEIDAIGRAVARGVPTLGVCLGAQLLAAALGARVYPASAPEIGILEVELTPEGARDPLFAGFPRRHRVFQWHGDTFDLPEGALWLARSEVCPHQAFRHGERAYGLQYHVEVTPEMVAEWGAVEPYCASLRAAKGTDDVGPLVESTDRHRHELIGWARRIFSNFLGRL